MQRKINQLRLQVLLITLGELLLIGALLTLYLLNVWGLKDVMPVEVIAYVCSGLIVFDCFYIWGSLFAIYKLRQKSDIRTSDVVGGDIQEAYIFGKLGFVVVDPTGTVLWISDLFTQRSMNIINENIYSFCPKLRDFIDKEVGDSIVVKLQGYDYNVKFLRNAGLFIFKDVSEYESLSKYASDQATCIGIISIDNYNDITSSNADFNDAINSVKSIVVDYAKNHGMLLRTIRNDTYFAICNHESLMGMINDGFSVLDKVREATLKIDTKPTLSIGFAYDFPDVNKLNDMASNALEIAMSRGGDQAVLSKYGSELEFFGGRTEAVEKRSKVKVRVFANSLISLIRRSSNVIIMGHLDMDMDALGSCLGVKAICDYCEKPVQIVYDPKLTERKTKSALLSSFSREELAKLVVSPKDAPDKVKPQSLVVVCDVSRPRMTMCKRLLDVTDKVVVIDHHRRAEEFIEHPVLQEVEPSASSACELVTELIKYNSETQQIPLPEKYATIMLAGIFLDTGFYKSKTVGLRTFDASMILKEYGADNGKADDFLKEEYEEYSLTNKIVETMKTPYYGVVYCLADEGEILEISSLAKAANACMQLKGVNCCFVIGRTGDDEVRMSARSDGSVNVQILCEKMNGGGHFTSAGAAFRDSSIKKVESLLLDTLANGLSDARSEKVKKEGN
ncbi:MAG: DHH family phosphoesterase [Bacilli bacterium]|nr:DHH family phosphoesterase [Bacilli bacterium]